MSDSFASRTHCRLCSGEIRTVLELPQTPLANELLSDKEAEWYQLLDETRGTSLCEGREPLRRFPLTLARCEACGHIQLREAVDPMLLFPPAYPYASGTSPVFRDHLERLAKDLVLAGGGHYQMSALEIGSNDGVMLRLLRSHGVRAIGVDPAEHQAEQTTREGYLTLPWAFDSVVSEAIRGSFGRFDIVVANNVLAHIDNMETVADGIRKLLDMTGALVLEVAYLPNMLRDGTFDLIYHEHQSYWHLAPMVAFWKRHDLELYDAEEVKSQGGSIRCFVGHPGCHPKTDRLARLLESEAESCSGEAVDDFAAKVDLFRNEFGERVRALAKEGEIGGFGCPAKAATLLHACGITREHIAFLVEENPRKVGQFAPGTYIPIISVGDWKKREAKRMVCFAWNFADDIIRRHSWFHGSWVVPFKGQS